MPSSKIGKLAPVTLGHMRSQGCRDLLVYCNSDRCNHSIIMNVGHLPDDTPIESLGDGFVCAQCGHLGADVAPNWPTHAAPRSSWSSALLFGDWRYSDSMPSLMLRPWH